MVGNRLYGPSRPNRPKLEFRRRLSVAGSRRCCATCASVGTPGTGGSGPGPSRRTLRSVVNPGEALKASTIRAAVQRRTIAVLCLAQLLSGFMNGVVLTVSPLLAVEITGSVGFAGMPMTAMAVVAALTAQPLAALAMKHGRRIALTGGLLLAALGSAGMMLAPLWRSFPVLLLGAGLVGAGMATHWQARFAATDLAIRATRARDLGLVVWAIAPGAIVGPNLVAPGSVLGASLGLPPLSGPFVFSLAGLVAAAVVLLVGLRPDPLFVAHQLEDSMAVVGPAADTPSTQSSFVVGLTAIRTSPRAVLGVAIVVSVQLLVVAIVSGTPVHLRILAESTPGHGGSAALVGIGLTMSLHLAGSYLLSPVIGWLADRAGRLPVALAAFGLLASAMVIAGFGEGSAPAVTVGLVLLGLGWSAGLIAGSALLAESVALEQRVPVQGVSDSLTGSAAAVGAAGAGAALYLFGFMTLNLIALVFTVLMALWCVHAIQERRKQRAGHKG